MNTTLQHTHWQIAANDDAPIQGEDDIHACIGNILSTRLGSDVLRPDFGSKHFDYIDQPFDIAVPNMVREIFNALSRWEKRIKVQAVKVSGVAPHFTLHIQWQVAQDILQQIYTTEVRNG